MNKSDGELKEDGSLLFGKAFLQLHSFQKSLEWHLAICKNAKFGIAILFSCKEPMCDLHKAAGDGSWTLYNTIAQIYT